MPLLSGLLGNGDSKPQDRRISIQVAVNLGNYESLRLSIEGPAAEEHSLRSALSELLGSYGRADPVTGELIDHYRKRVLSGV